MRNVVLVLLALAACRTPTPTPTPIPSPTPIPTPIATPTPTPTRANPVSPRFVEITAAGIPYTFRACEQLLVAVTRGNATALGERLAPGDVLVAQGAGELSVKGTGFAVVATVQPSVCEPNNATTLTKSVVRGSTAPELTWAGGKMHAHLDVGQDVSPNAYLGRLNGTAPVSEHTHPDSWEIICAVEAAGTFTLDGKEERLLQGQIIAVPPGAKHAWKPDTGKELVAIQMYAPPGPEQRFRVLAAAAHDGGAGEGGKK